MKLLGEWNWYLPRALHRLPAARARSDYAAGADTAARAREGVPHRAEPGRPAHARRVHVPAEGRRRPRRAPVHLRRARRAGLAARQRAARRRAREGRPGRHAAREQSRRCWRRTSASRPPAASSSPSTPASARDGDRLHPRALAARASCSLDAELAELVDAARPRRRPRDPGRRHGRGPATPTRSSSRRRRPSGPRACSRTRRRRSRSTTRPGTTGRPKGVQYTYRGAYLNALNEAIVAGLSRRVRLPVAAADVPLQRLVLHLGGHGRRRPPRDDPQGRPELIWDLIDARGGDELQRRPDRAADGGQPSRRRTGSSGRSRSSSPPRRRRRRCSRGWTSSTSASSTSTASPRPTGRSRCAPSRRSWRELPAARAGDAARPPGPGLPLLPTWCASSTRRCTTSRRDGETMGEVVMRGNNVMSGYFDDPEATETAFRGGWFHSGDLAVWHPDGNIELRDRGKDIIISGGENISSIEVEQTIVAHPAVLECAVVGDPARALGRAAEGVRDAERGRHRDRRGDHRVRPRAARALQVPGRGRVRPAAEDVDRQGAEVRPARARVGRPRRRGSARR